MFEVDSRGEKVVLIKLQIIVVSKPPQDSPGGFMASSLDEEHVEKQEAWKQTAFDKPNQIQMIILIPLLFS